MAYPTAAQLVSESTNQALISLDETEHEVLLLSSRAAIEQYTGQSFDYFPAQTRVIDSYGGRRLHLPARLESISAVTVSGSGLVADDVVLGDNNDVLTVRSDAGFSSYYERALWDIQGSPSMAFTEGLGAVSITGNWGWATFPAAVRNALRLDMEDQAMADTNSLSQTIRAYRGLGVADIQQGNLNVRTIGMPPLSERVVRLLSGYVFQGPVGAVV